MLFGREHGTTWHALLVCKLLSSSPSGAVQPTSPSDRELLPSALISISRLCSFDLPQDSENCIIAMKNVPKEFHLHFDLRL
jgi:hypothetical protein